MKDQGTIADKAIVAATEVVDFAANNHAFEAVREDLKESFGEVTLSQDVLRHILICGASLMLTVLHAKAQQLRKEKAQ